MAGSSLYPVLKNRTKKESTHNMARSQGFSVKDETDKASTWWIGIIKCEGHSVGSPQFLNSGRSSNGNVDSYQTVLELTVCGRDRSHGQWAHVAIHQRVTYSLCGRVILHTLLKSGLAMRLVLSNAKWPWPSLMHSIPFPLSRIPPLPELPT